MLDRGTTEPQNRSEAGRAGSASVGVSDSFWQVQGGKAGKAFREDCRTF